MWDGEDPQALDYLRVEKWFAKNCLAPLDKDQPQSLDEAHPFVEVEFVDGTRMSIYQGEPGHFRIRDKVFASETLRQGLKELMAFGKKFGYE